MYEVARERDINMHFNTITNGINLQFEFNITKIIFGLCLYLYMTRWDSGVIMIIQEFLNIEEEYVLSFKDSACPNAQNSTSKWNLKQ